MFCVARECLWLGVEAVYLCFVFWVMFDPAGDLCCRACGLIWLWMFVLLRVVRLLHVLLVRSCLRYLVLVRFFYPLIVGRF